MWDTFRFFTFLHSNGQHLVITSENIPEMIRIYLVSSTYLVILPGHIKKRLQILNVLSTFCNSCSVFIGARDEGFRTWKLPKKN